MTKNNRAGLELVYLYFNIADGSRSSGSDIFGKFIPVQYYFITTCIIFFLLYFFLVFFWFQIGFIFLRLLIIHERVKKKFDSVDKTKKIWMPLVNGWSGRRFYSRMIFEHDEVTEAFNRDMIYCDRNKKKKHQHQQKTWFIINFNCLNPFRLILFSGLFSRRNEYCCTSQTIGQVYH